MTLIDVKILDLYISVLYDICHITKYLSPPAHQIWVTDPLQAGTAAGTSFTKSVPSKCICCLYPWSPETTEGCIDTSDRYSPAPPRVRPLISRHLTTKHNPYIRCAPRRILRRRCDCKEENCGSVGHRTVWPHQHWLWMSHSEIVGHKKTVAPNLRNIQ